MATQHDQNQSESTNEKPKQSADSGWPFFWPIAIGIGAAIGAATDDMGTWIAIGVALGAAFSGTPACVKAESRKQGK